MPRPSYLFDTSCFYAVARSRLKQNVLLSMSPRIKTSPLAVLEIANLRKGPKDYEKRRRAMLALAESGTCVLRDSPDDVVSAAFGMPKPSHGAFDCTHAIRTLILARSYEEATGGVLDREAGIVRKLPAGILDQWKTKEAWRFVSEVVAGNRDYRAMLGAPPLETQEAERAMWTSEFPRFATLVGLALRAGLLRQYESECADFVEAATRFTQTLESRYNDSLEPYMLAYVSYRRKLTPGCEPERNALFDLEFFLHMDAGRPHLSLVTKEKLWLEIGRQVLPGRVLSLDELL